MNWLLNITFGSTEKRTKIAPTRAEITNDNKEDSINPSSSVEVTGKNNGTNNEVVRVMEQLVQRMEEPKLGSIGIEAFRGSENENIREWGTRMELIFEVRKVKEEGK